MNETEILAKKHADEYVCIRHLGDMAMIKTESGHSGPGYYTYYQNYPNEGSIFLGKNKPFEKQGST